MFGDLGKIMEALPQMEKVFAQVVEIANAMRDSQMRVEASQMRCEAYLKSLAEKAGVELE